MNEPIEPEKNGRNIWIRGLLMVLMGLAYYLGGTVLLMVAFVQFVMSLLANEPNQRLMSFGRSVGLYQSQIADFVSFSSEDVPFPFADWPSTN